MRQFTGNQCQAISKKKGHSYFNVHLFQSLVFDKMFSFPSCTALYRTQSLAVPATSQLSHFIGNFWLMLFSQTESTCRIRVRFWVYVSMDILTLLYILCCFIIINNSNKINNSIATNFQAVGNLFY